jgi:hypothetical protein
MQIMNMKISAKGSVLKIVQKDTVLSSSNTYLSNAKWYEGWKQEIQEMLTCTIVIGGLN